MKALIQRVSEASVLVGERTTGSIGKGVLVLLGVEENDNEKSCRKLAEKVMSYRIFPDKEGKMNLSLKDVEGELLVVSQFTLAADTRKGLRPSFTQAAEPSKANALYKLFVDVSSQTIAHVATGEFGADMKVALVNDGPVTITIDSKNKE